MRSDQKWSLKTQMRRVLMPGVTRCTYSCPLVIGSQKTHVNAKGETPHRNRLTFRHLPVLRQHTIPHFAAVGCQKKYSLIAERCYNPSYKDFLRKKLFPQISYPSLLWISESPALSSWGTAVMTQVVPCTKERKKK